MLHFSGYMHLSGAGIAARCAKDVDSGFYVEGGARVRSGLCCGIPRNWLNLRPIRMVMRRRR